MDNSLINITLDDILGTQCRGSSIFVTERKGLRQKIVTQHLQLNNYIDKLEDKIKRIVQHNEAQVLFAYRNHLNTVKRDMEKLKQKANSNAHSASSQLQKIDLLQKQLVIFREQSLRMFEKILEKDKVIQQLTIRLQEYQHQSKHMDNCFKSLLRKNKLLQHDRKRQNHTVAQLRHPNYTLQQQQSNDYPIQKHDNNTNQRQPNPNMQLNDIEQLNRRGNERERQKEDNRNRNMMELQMKERKKTAKKNIINAVKDIEIKVGQGTMRPSSKTHFASTRYKQRVHSMARTNKTAVDLEQRQQVQAKTKNIVGGSAAVGDNAFLHQQPNLLNKFTKKYISQHTKITNRTASNQTINVSYQQQQLKEYFRKCVETSKKEIMRRKNIAQSLNFYKANPITINEFKKVDMLSLLQLVLENEKVIEGVYQMIFQ